MIKLDIFHVENLCSYVQAYFYIIYLPIESYLHVQGPTFSGNAKSKQLNCTSCEHS